ncbi:rubredoxin [Persephonella sp.]
MEKRVNLKKQEVLKYKCRICGYIYDLTKGDEKRAVMPETPFEKLPDSWRCPVCFYPKSHFYQVKDGHRKEI